MSFWASLFGADQLQAEGNAADAKLAEMNQRDYSKGGHIYDLIEQQSGTPAADAAFKTVQDNLKLSQTGSVDSQISQAFDEGWNDGKANVSGTVGSIFGTAGDVLSSVLKGVPWWVWAGVILYFAWPIVAPIIARKAAAR